MTSWRMTSLTQLWFHSFNYCFRRLICRLVTFTKMAIHRTSTTRAISGLPCPLYCIVVYVCSPHNSIRYYIISFTLASWNLHLSFPFLLTSLSRHSTSIFLAILRPSCSPLSNHPLHYHGTVQHVVIAHAGFGSPSVTHRARRGWRTLKYQGTPCWKVYMWFSVLKSK